MPERVVKTNLPCPHQSQLTSSAVILLFGLNLRHLRRRSRASGGAFGNISERNLGLEGGRDSNMLAANGERIDSMSSAEGLPVTCKSRQRPAY
eukprot:751305-Hanusia_phi.AAC.2